MENNQRNSRKRLNSLILLVAFTAVMLIVSTYAWFSTQRNVTLTGLSGVVNVAEGLQISLDAERWVNAINFSDFNQPVDGGPWTQKTAASAQYISTAEGFSFQSPRGASGGVTNVTPTEYLPVSTTGEVIDAGNSISDGIGKSEMTFYNGEVQNFDHFEKINTTDEGYFAFDLFVMNTSASTVKFDKIQLDPSSNITGKVDSTGVQNTARIAFALYSNVNDTDSYKAYNTPDNAGTGNDMTIHSGNQLSPAQIVAGTNHNIEDIAIWEPNANMHVETIVNQFKGQMTWPSAWATKETGRELPEGDFANGNYLPTYALTAKARNTKYLIDAKGEGPEDDVYSNAAMIEDIFNWKEDATAVADGSLRVQYTTQTAGDATRGSIDLRSIKEYKDPTGLEYDGGIKNDGALDIEPNQYHKIRVYVWMEGQDPDCINQASLGGGLTLDLGFSKPSSENS